MGLATKVPVMELAPVWSADPATESEHVPELKMQLPRAVAPAAKLTDPVSAIGEPTYPSGDPPVTVAVKVVDWLVVILVAEALIAVVLVNAAVLHPVIRLFTFTLPMPVTWSKPGADG